MRLGIIFMVCAVAVNAQHAPAARARSGSFTNNGNALHPGSPNSTGVPPAGTFGVGTLVGPGPGFTGGYTAAPNPNGRGRVLALPYGYGGTYIGGYVGGYGPVYTPAPGTYDPIFGVYGPDAQQPPIVVFNQGYQPDVVRPQMMDYSNSLLPAPGPQYSPAPAVGSTIDGDTPMILIAMKDHTIYPALAFWLQGDTLNYVMVGGTVNHVSLGQVDRDLSLKLNAERRPDFKLP